MPTCISYAVRQQYLREMGVPVYFPRRPLPGAAPSRQYGADEPQPAAAPSGQHGADEPQPAADPVQALSFRFTWYMPDERMCVIAGHSTERLPLQLRQMLERILSALSSRYTGIRLQGTPFQWPLDPSMPADASAARQMVGAFLRRRFGNAVPPFMLVLMDEAPVWLFPEDSGELPARMLELFPHPQWTQTVLRVPSLEAMAADSSVKRPAWTALQSLIGPLAQYSGD